MRRAVSIQRVLVVFGALAVLYPGMELSGQDMPRGGQLRQFSRSVHPPLGLMPVSPGRGYRFQGIPMGWGYDYGTPWHIPQTQRYRAGYTLYGFEYPKLGLQYLYPDAIQMGIQVPPETDPIVEFSPHFVLPPASGTPKTGVSNSSISEGISLMRKGRFAEAGRLFARNLGDEAAPPELYLLIAEALLAAGKLDDAEIVLRQAVDVADALAFLDRADLPGKFPNEDVLKKKIAALDGEGQKALPLLKGTMLILAGEKEKGLVELRGAAREDGAAKRVYLHFLEAAFGGEEQK